MEKGGEKRGGGRGEKKICNEKTICDFENYLLSPDDVELFTFFFFLIKIYSFDLCRKKGFDE